MKPRAKGNMKRKDKIKSGNAITSQFIFNRDVWLEKSKIRENRRFSEVLSTPKELKEERENKK